MRKDQRHSSNDDATLVASWRSGEFSSFEELVRKYQKPMFNIAFRITGNYGDACEVVQDAFVDVYRGEESFRGASRFFTLLTGFVVGHSRNRLQQEQVQPRNPPYPVDRPVGENSGLALDATVSGQTQRDDMPRCLQESIGALLADLREVLVLRDLQNLSCSEIGAILNIQEVTVKARLCRAREIIAENLTLAVGWR
jgi:RNA polymerase sigma-70 factor (ECF subfamily)